MGLFFAGIDIGSTMTKALLIDDGGAVLSVVKGPTGPEHRSLADEVMRTALDHAGLRLDDVSCIVATGYGRMNVPFADRQITELTCHARGVYSLIPGARTAIDIGGQDAKCMKLSNGKVINFAMNDKCAAGTGRFLEVMARALDIELEDMGGISLRSTRKVQVSNLCTIFTRQEVVARLSEGERLEDVLAALHDALASRVAALARRLGIECDVVLTGGVALNVGMVRAMGEYLRYELLVPPDPLITGALGAALLARDQTLEAKAIGRPLAGGKRHLERATFFV